jgi:FtsJ-like methyltransferase
MSTSKRRRFASELGMDDGQFMSDSRNRDYFDVIVRGTSSNNQHEDVASGEGDNDSSHSQNAATSERLSSDGYSLYHQRMSQQHQHHARNPPRSSWLCHVDWLVSTNSSDEKQSSISLPQPPQSKNVEADISDAMHEDEDEEEEYSSIQDSIRSLSIQLLQVKRRMFPAAERCAEAHNSVYSSDDHRLATTARKEFAVARNACNPYEILTRGRRGGYRNHHGGGAGGLGHLFLNRAAIKLANIDAILDFSLTNHHHHYHRHCHQDGAVGAAAAFVFVDLCGAPGGFSEYILWRCSSRRANNCQTAIPTCRGYGMSLQGSNEYGGGK